MPSATGAGRDFIHVYILKHQQGQQFHFWEKIPMTGPGEIFVINRTKVNISTKFAQIGKWKTVSVVMSTINWTVYSSTLENQLSCKVFNDLANILLFFAFNCQMNMYNMMCTSLQMKVLVYLETHHTNTIHIIQNYQC